MERSCRVVDSNRLVSNGLVVCLSIIVSFEIGQLLESGLFSGGIVIGVRCLFVFPCLSASDDAGYDRDDNDRKNDYNGDGDDNGCDL